MAQIDIITNDTGKTINTHLASIANTYMKDGKADIVSSFIEDKANITKHKDKITTIGSKAFYNCTTIQSAEFPVVTEIDDYAFYKCTNMTIADCPLCTSIGAYAFYGADRWDTASNLSKINFPLVTNIGAYAFCRNQKLEIINPVYDGERLSLDGVFELDINIGAYAFVNCTSLTHIGFKGKATIGADAFSACYALSQVMFLKDVTIGEEAFWDCDSLEMVVLYSDTVCTLESTTAFSDTPSTMSIYVPADLVDTYKSATNWTTYADRIKSIDELPEGE